jgi:hypothetical protein
LGAVLEKLLAGDQPVLATLRSQVTVCAVTARDLTGVGFFTSLAVPPTASRAPLQGRAPPVGDVLADLRGIKHGAGFLLYIADGALAMLEGYTFDEPWPADTDQFSLRYEGTERRILPGLLGG